MYFDLFVYHFQDQSLKESELEPKMIIEGGINLSSGSVTGEKDQIPGRSRGRPKKVRPEESTAPKENHAQITVN